MGKTSSAVKDKYNKKVYDEIKARVKKGEKEIIKAHAESKGESLNGFINRAIKEAIERDTKEIDGFNIINSKDINEIEKIIKNAAYLQEIDESIQQIKDGKVIIKTMEELEKMEE